MENTVEVLKTDADRAWARLEALKALGAKYLDMVEKAELNANAASRRYIAAVTAAMFAELKK
jgi:hypothetical protein